VSASGAGAAIRAVLFDVDFTICRPGPELGPEGYRRLGERYGLVLDPSLHDGARAAAELDVKHHPELKHDEEIWIAFTERIVRGMGGGAAGARACAEEMSELWNQSENFELYEDVVPVLEELRLQGLKLGLVSNTGRDLDAFVAHHHLDVDVAVAAGVHGLTKPHESIFRAAIEQLEVRPAEAAMIGDSIADDVEGARALGMQAFLVDRRNRFPEVADRLTNLYALPAALGLPRPGTAKAV
jgi:HAD superfamily hydrolase (TIGR01662 family)